MTACRRVYEQLTTSSGIITGDGVASFTRAVLAVDGCPSVRPSVTSAVLHHGFGAKHIAPLHNVQLLTVKHMV